MCTYAGSITRYEEVLLRISQLLGGGPEVAWVQGADREGSGHGSVHGGVARQMSFGQLRLGVVQDRPLGGPSPPVALAGPPGRLSSPGNTFFVSEPLQPLPAPSRPGLPSSPSISRTSLSAAAPATAAVRVAQQHVAAFGFGAKKPGQLPSTFFPLTRHTSGLCSGVRQLIHAYRCRFAADLCGQRAS